MEGIERKSEEQPGLPKAFVCRMKEWLSEEYPLFLASYQEPRTQGLRLNGLKGDLAALEKVCRLWFHLEPVPWTECGFYYGEEDRPGKHPYHEAGLYYIQEPSAMAVVEALGVEPGDRVLDLCAAPGGKSTQIAARLQGKGLLVSNEIHPARAKILSQNIERMGAANVVVMNHDAQVLAQWLPGFFDKIVVDAPCSGEGMFRKNEEARGEWSLENVRLCADRQDGILDCADEMLRPGGRLVYSTCTFAPAENEGSIARFLARHQDYQILEVHRYDGMSDGVPAWAYYDDSAVSDSGGDHGVGVLYEHGIDMDALRHTIRLYPHLIRGEGHYLAVLQKRGDVPDGYRAFPANGLQKGIHGKEVREFWQFCQETLKIDLTADAPERLLRFGEQLYLMPKDMPSIKGLKVLRAGLHLGTLRKNRFEPSHALALALCKEEAKRSMELTDAQAKAYLGGMTLNCEGEKGWYLMTYQGYSIGWGKLAGQIMKNHYPKGLRK